MLLSVHDWTFYLGPVVIFSITALILNYTFYRSRLVPRFISVWGFIGGMVLLIAGLLSMFGIDAIAYGVPLIALNEMVLAVWVLVKGFDLSYIDQ